MNFREQRGQGRSWFGEKEDKNKLNIELMYGDIRKLYYFPPKSLDEYLFNKGFILREEEYPKTNKLTCVLGLFPRVWSPVL